MSDSPASVPEFAGYRYVNGELVVHLTSSTAEARMKPFVDSLLQARARRGKQARGHRFVIAAHSFGDLARWRTALRPVAMGTEGVYSIDADEANNTVTFGVDQARQGAVERTIRAAARDLGVPQTALRFELETPLQRLQTLRDYQRPLRSSFQIIYRISETLGGFCSIGWTGYWNDGSQRQSVVTAQHCDASYDGRYYQNSLSAGHFIGYSVDMPTVYTCYYGSTQGNCMYGDLRVIDVTGDSWDHNKIARTTGDESITVHSTTPTWTIIGEVPSVALGDLDENLSWSQGRTNGSEDVYDVNGTCIDFFETSWPMWYMCMYRAGGDAADGDSGGPVYEIYNSSASEVLLVGIISGEMFRLGCGCNDLVFTPMNVLHAEIPKLETLTPY